MSDVDFLLAQTIADVKLNHRMLLYEPAGPLTACPTCEVMYGRARRLIDQAGGVEKWMEQFRGPSPAPDGR
jgi:hypothetical protein